MTSPYGAPQVPGLNAPMGISPFLGIQPGSSPLVITVTTIIIVPSGTNQGIFVYNTDPPQTGSLVGSWAPQAGTDPYGNSYFEGICIGQMDNTEIQIRPDLDGAFFYSA
jgi:hypothetical protein